MCHNVDLKRLASDLQNLPFVDEVFGFHSCRGESELGESAEEAGSSFQNGLDQ